ncbi:MAG: putative LPS assembly protein LptD, partial [candidate division WOR-3 bacterium]|nr:putative LPS assembly protein LptD [candidate division WOR-3 bacterium]
GNELWLIKEKTLQVVDGRYTTCDHNPPHYYFSGKKSKVLLDNTAITQGVVMKIFELPCGVAPFWFFPISKHRKSGLLPFKFGRSALEGRYLKGVSYYWVINDYADMTFMLDIMEKKGFQPKLEAIYIVNPYARGQVLASYIREIDTKKQRYSINAQHRSKFFLNSNLESYIDYQSDQSYLPDYAENKAQWLKKEIYSQLSINKEVKKIGKIGILTDIRSDFKKKVTDQRLPSITVNFYRLPLLANWSVTPQLSFANSKRHYDSTATFPHYFTSINQSINSRWTIANPKTTLGGFELPVRFNYQKLIEKKRDSVTSKYHILSANTGFTTSQTMIQTLNISEGFNYTQTLTFKPDTQVATSQYDFSLSSSITLYRIFLIRLFGLENILHQVSPSLGFSIRPQVKQYPIFGIPKIDTTPQNANLAFGLNSYFQGKKEKSDEKIDITSMTIQSSYNFITKELTPLACNADFYFIRQQNVQLVSNIGMTYPWEKDLLKIKRFSNITVNTVFTYSLLHTDSITNQEKGIRIALNHFLSTFADTAQKLHIQSHMLTGTLSFQPTGWSFDLNAGLNFKEKRLTDYSLSIWKDLHCWEAIITINRFGAQWAYDFKVRIKKIPDVAVGKGILGFVVPLP